MAVMLLLSFCRWSGAVIKSLIMCINTGKYHLSVTWYYTHESLRQACTQHTLTDLYVALSNCVMINLGGLCFFKLSIYILNYNLVRYIGAEMVYIRIRVLACTSMF